MKKLISIFVLSVVVVLLSCGSGDTADTAGVRIGSKIPQHGHSNMYDGGVLKPAGAMVYSAVGNLCEIVGTPSAACSPDWGLEYYDTVSTHSTVTNPNVFTVPTGYVWANLTCSLMFTSNTTSIYALTTVSSTAAGFPVMQYSLKFTDIAFSSDIPRVDIDTGIVPVVAGNTFALSISNFNTATIAIHGARSWCQFQVFR